MSAPSDAGDILESNTEAATGEVSQQSAADSRSFAETTSEGGGATGSELVLAAVPAQTVELANIEPNAVEIARQKPPTRRRRFKLLQRDFDDIAAAAQPPPYYEQYDGPNPGVNIPKPTRKVLDGFFLLKEGKVEFPEEVTRLVIQNKNLGAVAAEDLSYFTNLKFLDASDNYFELDKFGHLSALFELRLRYNHISTVGDCSLLKCLEILDLSYNNLTEDAIGALGSIPRLRKLDLSGNNLRSIPRDIRKLRKVQELNLSSNFLGEPDIIMRLADMPRLRELDLENVGMKKFPDCSETNFIHLEWVNLGRNLIETEYDIGGLISLKRLNHVVLYGNPLTDQDGDPFQDHVTVGDRTIRLTCQVQEAEAAEPFSLKDMYRSTKETGTFGPMKVSSQQWKERGNKEVFGDGSPSTQADQKTKPSGDDTSTNQHEVDWAAQYEDQAVLQPPSGVVELSASKLHNAIIELREMLKNPIHYDPNYHLRHNFAKTTALSAARMKKKIKYKKKPQAKSQKRTSHDRRTERHKLNQIEGMLDRMALSDEEEEEGGEMFATEIGADENFSYTDTTKGIADIFNPNSFS